MHCSPNGAKNTHLTNCAMFPSWNRRKQTFLLSTLNLMQRQNDQQDILPRLHPAKLNRHAALILQFSENLSDPCGVTIAERMDKLAYGDSLHRSLMHQVVTVCAFRVKPKPASLDIK
jgi:ABC-type molybdate transport system substrate-binding protein